MIDDCLHMHSIVPNIKHQTSLHAIPNINACSRAVIGTAESVHQLQDASSKVWLQIDMLCRRPLQKHSCCITSTTLQHDALYSEQIP